MAQTALTQLQQQIEAVRREAFAAGYAAAMQAFREFTSKPAAGAETPTAPAQRRGRARRAGTAGAQPSPQRQTRPARTARRGGQRSGRASGRRPQRGTNARLVEE